MRRRVVPCEVRLARLRRRARLRRAWKLVEAVALLAFLFGRREKR